MFLFENPVLQRELLLNLRRNRSFLLLLFYTGVLGLVVLLAWPQEQVLDLTRNPEQAQKLFNLFFLGQFILASLIAPSFAAGAISGEKERKTYEMLLASPLFPSAIVIGKLLASLLQIAILIVASLPIVMLCLPLGGFSIYELLATYMALLMSVLTFCMISIACSTYFRRTISSLVVSYLLILPLALFGILFWNVFATLGTTRLFISVTFFPICCLLICYGLFSYTKRRLLYPPDVGSDGKDVVNLDEESKKAVGLVIQPDQFPDKLFAPPKRDDLLLDGQNPVFDKEMRSEIFSSGTLMLRVVIQVSWIMMFPLMAYFLYISPHLAPLYISYVLSFNMLVGPVFPAGSITGERERQTLDLLLTTTISPWQILWGKLLSALRVSCVLTMFLLLPLALACVMVSDYWPNMLSIFAYIAIILMTCFTTTTIALFCSLLCRRTSISLMVTYMVIVGLFILPLAIQYFSKTFFLVEDSAASFKWLGTSSPFSTAYYSVPLSIDGAKTVLTWNNFWGYMLFTSALIIGLLSTMIWLFNQRWRVSD